MARRIRRSRAQLKCWNELVATVKLINFALNNVSIYPATHSEVKDVVQRLHNQMRPIFNEQDDLGIGYMDEVLYIEGAMSIDETRNNEMLIERVKFCRIKYLTIMKDASVEDLLQFFVVVNEASKSVNHRPLPELLDEAGVETVSIVEAEADEEADRKGRRKTLLDWYEKIIEALPQFHKKILDDPRADLRPLYRIADDMMATMRTKGHDAFLLLPVLSRRFDPHMAHNVNVAIYCGALGYQYGLNAGQVQTLCVAAFLHDVGRCIIPLEWAKEESPLSLFERAVVSQHPAWSFLLLARNPELPAPIPLLAAHHHDNPAQASAATGYTPDIMHKILSAADTFDLAALSDRIYWKKARHDRMLRRILHRRGRWYDPTVAKALVQLVGYYPPGTLLRLADGQRGIVVRNDPGHAARPLVYLFDAPAPVVEKKEMEKGIAPEFDIGPPPALLDLMELEKGRLRFKHAVAATLGAAEGVDVAALIDAKKEHLLDPQLAA